MELTQDTNVFDETFTGKVSALGLRGFKSHSPHQRYTLTTVAKENIVNFLLYLKAKGLKESTLIEYSKVIRHLDKHEDVNNTKQVKLFIANKNVKDSTKEKICNQYDSYVKWEGLTWEKPIYQRDTTLPYIPLEKEIDQLIFS